MVFYGTTLMDGLIWKCYLLHYRQQILRYINTDYRWHSACLWVIEDRRTVHERSWVLDSTCCSMPKTAFVILFSNVTVLFSRVTHNTFPLSLAHIVKTGTQRAENTTFYLQCIMPIRWITDSTWLSASFLSSASASVEPTRTWMCDCWILVPFTKALAAFSPFGRQLHLNSPQLCVFGLFNWLQKSWESEFNLQAEQVDCTAVLGQETRKSRKCLMNYHEHNKPEERKSHKWEQLGLPESHVIIRRKKWKIFGINEKKLGIKIYCVSFLDRHSCGLIYACYVQDFPEAHSGI